MYKITGIHKTFVYTKGARKLVKEVEDYVYQPFPFGFFALLAVTVGVAGYIVLEVL